MNNISTQKIIMLGLKNHGQQKSWAALAKVTPKGDMTLARNQLLHPQKDDCSHAGCEVPDKVPLGSNVIAVPVPLVRVPKVVPSLVMFCCQV